MLESNFKIRPECLRNIKISTLLLKRGAARGLTLAQIGKILCRPDEDDSEPSLLEKIVKKAELCTSAKQQMQSQIKDSISFNIGIKAEESKTEKKSFGGIVKNLSNNSISSLQNKQNSMKSVLHQALADQKPAVC